MNSIPFKIAQKHKRRKPVGAGKRGKYVLETH